jgi:hypothetical protein
MKNKLLIVAIIVFALTPIIYLIILPVGPFALKPVAYNMAYTKVRDGMSLIFGAEPFLML